MLDPIIAERFQKINCFRRTAQNFVAFQYRARGFIAVFSKNMGLRSLHQGENPPAQGGRRVFW